MMYIYVLMKNHVSELYFLSIGWYTFQPPIALTFPTSPQNLPLCPLEPCYEKCSLGPGSISYSRELAGYADPPALSQTYGIRIGMPGELRAHEHCRNIALEGPFSRLSDDLRVPTLLCLLALLLACPSAVVENITIYHCTNLRIRGKEALEMKAPTVLYYQQGKRKERSLSVI